MWVGKDPKSSRRQQTDQTAEKQVYPSLCCMHVSLASFNVTLLFLSYMSHIMRKPVFGIFDQVRLKPACSAHETS